MHGLNETLGGLIDVAPTILHILGLPPETSWEGRSLFDANRSDQLFLFAPNHEMVAGYRQGHRKFMYQVSRDKAFAYDLISDPAEKQNLADEHSSRTIRGQLSGWLQQENRRIGEVLR